ncbi:MAG: PD40 domain-containing protein [Planctomycetes bacterium]|nr:PD40 domain-containing protein [Planctomycetota bacterium]MBL7037875.1 PD40 domain-containing protein [Pirellulaceae bacterium]
MKSQTAFTLPVLLVLVAPAAGNAAEPSEGRDVAIAAIVKLGGRVRFDEQKAVLGVVLEGPKVNDASLVHVKALTEIKSLVLWKTDVTDAGMVHLRDLRQTKVSDKGVLMLKELTRLRTLQLEDARVTAKGVETLRKALPNCRISHNVGNPPKAGQAGRAARYESRHVSVTIPSVDQETDIKELPRLRTLRGHRDDVLSLAFLPASTTLVSASQDKTIRFWDAQSGELKRMVAGHSVGVQSVASSPDGTILASAGFDGMVKLWDTNTVAQLRVLKGTIPTSEGDVTSIVWSPDGKLLAVSGRRVVVWDAASGERRRVLELEGMKTLFGDYIAWTANRKLATAGDEMSTIRFWEVDTGKISPDLTHRGHIHSMAINPDRKVLVTGGHSPYLTFFDLATGTKRTVARGDPHYWLSWSPDGNTLAAGSILLDSTGNVRATVDAWKKKTSWPMWSSGPVVAWSSDSKVFATVREKDIDLWDTSSLAKPH